MAFEEVADTIYVAITGALSSPRKAVATLINGTANGHFVDTLSRSTHFLVATSVTSNKARDAARWGTTVISEAELQEFLAQGRFPCPSLPGPATRARSASRDEVSWSDQEPAVYLLNYRDGAGLESVRQMLWTAKGRSDNAEWLAGYDALGYKTWRADRVLGLEYLEAETQQWRARTQLGIR